MHRFIQSRWPRPDRSTLGSTSMDTFIGDVVQYLLRICLSDTSKSLDRIFDQDRMRLLKKSGRYSFGCVISSFDVELVSWSDRRLVCVQFRQTPYSK